ncbi:MAG: vWA domain-containing protein [Elusimicrobiota bacterium]
MKWENSIFLYLLLLIPFIGLGLLYRELKRLSNFKEMINVEGIVQYSSRKIIIKLFLLIGGIVFLIIAAAGPRWGMKEEKVKRPVQDVIIVTDISSSMGAEDITPSRIKAARNKINFIIDELSRCRLGLIFFGGSAFIHCPVTFDTGAAKSFIKDAWKDVTLLPGTNIEKAISLGIEAFPASKKDARRYILLVTDGEELQGNYERTINSLKKEDVKVITYGIGTTQGARIPFYEDGKLTGFKKDQTGGTVVSRLGENLLAHLAKESGGKYVRYTKNFDDISEISGSVKVRTEEENRIDTLSKFKMRYQLPLLLGIVLLAAGFMMGNRGKLR